MNFDLTKGLLNLVTHYASILYLLGQIDDRKAICALYNIAHENTRGSGLVTNIVCSEVYFMIFMLIVDTCTLHVHVHVDYSCFFLIL